MKRLLIGVMLLCGLIGLSLLWKCERDVTLRPARPAHAVDDAGSVRNSNSDSVSLGAGAAAMPTNAAILHKDKNQQMREGLAKYNEATIVFYGKVIDQFGDVLAHTKVRFSVRHNNGTFVGVTDGEVYTDADGHFAITNQTGKSLGVLPEREGYVLASTNNGGIYSHLWPEAQRMHPDPKKPEVIRMWKLQGAEPLVTFEVDAWVPCDGTPVRVSVEQGRIVERGGDLVVTVHSPVDIEAAWTNRDGYDWSVSVEASEGGGIQLREASPFVFEAPSTGYQPSVVTQYKHGIRPWLARTARTYFTRFKGPAADCFGYLRLSIITDRVKSNRVAVSLNGYYNPSGSRNLEYDENLVKPARPEPR